MLAGPLPAAGGVPCSLLTHPTLQHVHLLLFFCVPGRIFGADFEKEGHDITSSIDLNSDIFNPTYNFRLEFRDVQFSKQATLLVKIYTIEVNTKELVVIGYCAMNIFVRREPSNSTPMGDQFDFVWLSARTPHGAYVWRA